MKLTKQTLRKMIKEEMLNEGGEKTYKSLMNLEKGIKDLEKTFKGDKRDMRRDRASKIRKHIVDIKRSWTAIWADFQER
jgi:excinuclease UvrABC helicase subunit UvrB